MDWTYLLTTSCLQALSQEAKDAFQEYNVEAIEKFKSRTVYETNFVSNIHEDSQDMIASSNEEIEDEDTQLSHPDQFLEHQKRISLISSIVNTTLKIN